MHWYLDVLKKYATFSGRARRQEYWMFLLFHIIAVFILTAVDMAIFGMPALLYFVYLLGTLIPSLALSVRRLHDVGKSGWWLLLSFVPFGSLVLLFWAVSDSKPGDNAYGPNPKGVAA